MKTMFFGDVSPSFDSKELFRNEEVDILFGDVQGIMKNNDFVFVNLETAITDCDESNNIKKFGPCLSAPKETVKILKELGQFDEDALRAALGKVISAKRADMLETNLKAMKIGAEY